MAPPAPITASPAATVVAEYRASSSFVHPDLYIYLERACSGASLVLVLTTPSNVPALRHSKEEPLHQSAGPAVPPQQKVGLTERHLPFIE